MTWVSGLVLAFVVVNLVYAMKGRGKLAESWALVSTLRPMMFVKNLPVITAVIVTAGLLHQVPGLDWGWWKLVSGHDGNVMVASATSSLWLYVPFLVLLVVAIPQLAIGEEEVFRQFTTGNRSMWVRSIVFGLAHCVAGVSIGIGLALAISGLWYTRQWRKGRDEFLAKCEPRTPGAEMVAAAVGVRRSAAYHVAWNYTVVGLLTATLIVAAS